MTCYWHPAPDYNTRDKVSNSAILSPSSEFQTHDHSLQTGTVRLRFRFRERWRDTTEYKRLHLTEIQYRDLNTLRRIRSHCYTQIESKTERPVNTSTKFGSRGFSYSERHKPHLDTSRLVLFFDRRSTKHKSFIKFVTFRPERKGLSRTIIPWDHSAYIVVNTYQ